MLPVKKTIEWMPTFFDDFFLSSNWFGKNNSMAPAVNIIESDDEFRIEIAAAGMTKDDFCVKINDDNILEVSMEKKDEKQEKEKKEKYIRREFSYTHFKQSLSLPDNILKDKILAKMENGVLTITIPRNTSTSNEKKEYKIEIM